jgi:hypothetical protein
MRPGYTILKSFTRTVVDYCVLPGAAIGAEILWIYTKEWKNRCFLLTLAVISFAYSNMQIENYPSGKAISGPENTR